MALPESRKLVDNDDIRYSVTLLREWKRIAEQLAERELQNPHFADAADDVRAFAKAERLMPDLIGAMRADLSEHPLKREFVILKKGWAYNTQDEVYLAYFHEDHPELDGKLQIFEGMGLIAEVTRTNVARFRFMEPFVEQLVASRTGPSRYRFVENVGVLFDPTTHLHLCPRCLPRHDRAFLKNETRGFRCTICGQYFGDPKRARPSEPPRNQGPLSWMG